MIALMIVVDDEGLDAGGEVTRQKAVLLQDAVLQGLLPALDLGLSDVLCLRP